MKTLAIVFGVILGIGLIIGLSLFATYVSYHNMGVRMEQSLGAVWEENKVVLNSYTSKVQEVAQVPDMFRDDLEKVIEKTFEGRYGQDGSKAVFQFIQEQNMSLDPQLYRSIQQVMESGRNEFKTTQTSLIDVKRAYETQLNSFWSGLWLGLAGFPKVDLSKYQIIVLDEVDTKFNTGKDEVIKLRISH